MDKKNAEKEIDYQLIKLLLLNMQRAGFQKLMADAKTGAFDLIITKSISRFAKNTVDLLTCIRLLKEYRIEVYFQKEDIWTFNSKGEFMITLLSSMAQEESRSISENVTWGHCKRFSDGKYTVPFKHFLDYDRGLDGGLVVNQSQAILVRLIFKFFLEGKTPASICRYLNQLKIPTPGGKDKWSQTVINSMLANKNTKALLYCKSNLLSIILPKGKRKTKVDSLNIMSPAVMRQLFQETLLIICRKLSSSAAQIMVSNTVA